MAVLVKCLNIVLQNVFTVHAERNQGEQDWEVKLKVADKDLLLEIDSGAMCNELSRITGKKFRPLSALKNSDTIINGVSDKQIKALRTMALPCENNGVKTYIVFEVVGTPRKINLLGRQDCWTYC